MKKVPEKEKVKILEFYDACNDMINGKFILADIKISRILKGIANSEELYSLLGECLVNFNFEKEFAKAKANGFSQNTFAVDEKDKLIAMVFCFLVEVDNKNMGFYDFITSYFHSNSGGASEYASFAKALLIPFRDSVMSYFNLNEEWTEEDELIKQNYNITKLSYEEAAINALTELKNEVEFLDRIKDDNKNAIIIFINALIEGINIKNLKIISALAIALDCEVKSIKKLRAVYHLVCETLADLYNK